MSGVFIVAGMLALDAVPGMGIVFVTVIVTVFVFQGLNRRGNEFLINMTILVGIDAMLTVQLLTLTLKRIQLCQHSLFSLDTHHAASLHPHGQPDRLAQTDNQLPS